MRAFVFSDVIQPPATRIPRHRDRVVFIDRTQKIFTPTVGTVLKRKSVAGEFL